MKIVFMDDTDEKAFDFLLDNVEDNYLLSQLKFDININREICLFKNLEYLYHVNIFVVNSLKEIESLKTDVAILITKADSFFQNIDHIKSNSFKEVIFFGEILKPHQIDILKNLNVKYQTFKRSSHQMVAEHIFTLLLMHYRKMTDSKIQNFYSPANTPRRRYLFNWMGIQGVQGLYNKTIGIVGLGEIGVKVARIANAFGMLVVYTQREENPTLYHNAKFVDKKRLLANSDIISLNIPLNNSTINYLSKDDFKVLKKGAVIVNSARARLIEKKSLEHWLESDSCGGYLADVHYIEPVDKEEVLHTKTLLTPHIGGLPVEAHISDILTIINNITMEK